MHRGLTATEFIRRLRLLTGLTATPLVASSIVLTVGFSRAQRTSFLLVVSLVVLTLLWGIARRATFGFNDRRIRFPSLLLVFDCIWAMCLLAPLAHVFAWLSVAILSVVRPEQLTLRSVALATWIWSAGLSVYGVFVRRYWLHIRHVQVALPKMPKTLDVLRVVHWSDLHLGTNLSRAFAQNWIEVTKKLQPDIVCITGDMLTTGTDYHEDVIDLLMTLNQVAPVFVCLGNHDYYEEDQLTERLRASGVHVLRNEGVRVNFRDHPLWICGVEDAIKSKASIEAALAKRTDEVLTILLDHQPNGFQQAAGRVDLMLAGHVHGGQIAVPFAAKWLHLGRLMSVYPAGLYTEKESKLYVHRGLGTTGPSVRLGVAPEIVLLSLSL